MAKKNYTPKPKAEGQGESKSREDAALETFTDLLIDKIKTIKDDWRKPWFSPVACAWPRNLSNREYNGQNALMLQLKAEKEGYTLPVWGTFERITGLNFTKDKEGKSEYCKDKEGNPLPRVFINKGEKSFPVALAVYSVVHKETKEKIDYRDYKLLSREERAKYNVFPKMMYYNVFNVGQTNIQEARPELYKKLQEQSLPKHPEGYEETDRFEFPAMDKMISENKWICPIKEVEGDDAYFSISKNEIVIPERMQFSDNESFYSNCWHECIHSTGHESQLGRLKPATFGSDIYSREELVAELGAAVTANRYNLTKHIKVDSAAYLKNWLDQLNESPEFLKTVLADVKKATSMLTQRIDKIQMEIDNEQQMSQDKVQAPLKELAVVDIPEWSLNYLVNGDATNLTDEEVKIVDDYLDENFHDGYIMDIDYEDTNDFNRYPAFGQRNENALTNHGESPFLATKTVKVRFLDPKLRETQQQSTENEVKPKPENQEEQHRRGFHR